MEVVVGNLLRHNHATLAVAESCTGGLLGERITSVPGSSDYFIGGFLTYADAAKIEMLGVPPEMLERFGAVSKETAEAMATGARLRTGATYALSVTGVAGPDPVTGPGGAVIPAGTVYVAVADAAGVRAVHRVMLGFRQNVRAFTAQMAMDLLRRRILGRI